ncbi:MAG TPA: PfkB family carbohydrate kinase [Candidatus Baltobacteraceae bacterium]|nr:PfkB family carbohydrate kinase [Candidatus Baltobacteraceae bacterium]
MPKILCVGGACIDRKYATRNRVLFDSSNPARMTTHFGGVARNVAENLARLGVAVDLLACVGADAGGEGLVAHLARTGVATDAIEYVAGSATGEYAAIVDPDGNLLLGVVDSGAIDALDVAYLERHTGAFATADWVFLDTNLSAECIDWVYANKRSSGYKLAADGVSEAKVPRLGIDLGAIDVLFLKQAQAQTYLGTRDAPPEDVARSLRARGARCTIVTCGADGCIVASEDRITHLPAVAASPIDATGAGDALIAAALYRLLAGDATEAAAAIGTLLAAMTVESGSSVLPNLSAESLERQGHRISR